MQYSNHSSKVYLFGNSCIIDFVVIEKNLDSGRILKERPPGCRKLHEIIICVNYKRQMC
jgi:hypothetical protein